ncbi:hypothetical protein [Nodularia sp. UHCC 0506]|uniref:hypothetical protein n=1 Tax=Nodularia sp. UHCC 0506 TaxID=3110243 RepID=UPI002B1F6977|nr:hypothetical protein [Nodularia sp. UHCC 0506]MEA5513132.1 hypothetical protein [Nodularia sp. UHCC 0506]
MNIWIDAQLPPTLASWITNTFAIEAFSLRDIGLRDAKNFTKIPINTSSYAHDSNEKA